MSPGRPHRNDPHRDKRGGAIKRLRRAAHAARSQLKRYPKAVAESVSLRRRRLSHAPAGPREVLPDLSRHDMAAIWLGHATALLRVGKTTILTDPVLSERIGPSVARMTIGIPRLAPPPTRPSDLPPIDLVLLSHAHFDHLDKPTLRAIASRHTTVVTARRTGRLIPPGFGRVIELDWHEVLRFRGLHLSALRPAHWGARTALDRDRGYNSYVVRGDPGGVLFAGDTAYTRAFDDVRGVRLALLGIGASRNWEHAHATPEEAWAMFQAMGGGTAEHLLPVHHATFPIGDEHPDEPMQRLLAAAGPEAGRVIRAAPGALWAGK